MKMMNDIAATTLTIIIVAAALLATRSAKADCESASSQTVTTYNQRTFWIDNCDDTSIPYDSAIEADINLSGDGQNTMATETVDYYTTGNSSLNYGFVE